MSIELDRGHLPALLNSASLAYQNAEYRINKIMKPVFVNKKADKVLVSDVENAFTASNLARGTDGRSNRSRTKYTTAPYVCSDAAQHDYVADSDIKNADMPAFDLYQETTLTLTNKILLGREIKGATFLRNASNYSGFTEDLNGAWADVENVNIASKIKSVQKQMLMPGNVLAIGGVDADLLTLNAKLLARVSGGSTSENPGLIYQEETLARVLDLDAVIILNAKQRTNPDAPDASAQWSSVWSNFAVLMYVQDINAEAMKMRLRMATFGFMASYDPDGMDRLVQINTNYNKEIDGGSQFIEAQACDGFAVGLPGAGFLFTDIRTNT